MDGKEANDRVAWCVSGEGNGKSEYRVTEEERETKEREKECGVEEWKCI